MQIIGCPDPGCGAPAEVVDRWVWPSTDGPVEHVKTRCLRGQVFTVPVEPQTLDDALALIMDRARPGTAA